MPADHLNLSLTRSTQTAAATPKETAEAVLAVLTGTPLEQAAARLGMPSADLADALETYQQARHAALAAQAAACGWYQIHAQFPEWTTAEKTTVTDLGPQLQCLQDAGVIAAWWFIRKAPC